MPRYHNVDGNRVQFTSVEETTRDAEEKVWADGASARVADVVQKNRRLAYRDESDALFFEEQAGEVSAGTHAAKRAEIKARYPKG